MFPTGRQGKADRRLLSVAAEGLVEMSGHTPAATREGRSWRIDVAGSVLRTVALRLMRGGVGPAGRRRGW